MLKQLKWILTNYNRYDSSISYATYSRPCSFVARTSSKNKILFVHNDYCASFNNDKYKINEFFKGIRLKKFNHMVFVRKESRINLSK